MKFILISIFAAWFIAQASKSIFSKAKKSKSFFRCGGMPSAHTAFVSALCTSVGIVSGFYSAIFCVSLAFSIIVAHDAIQVRKHHTLKQVIVGALVGILVAVLVKSIFF